MSHSPPLVRGQLRLKTEETAALIELAEKLAERDLVREMLAFAAERIMEAGVRYPSEDAASRNCSLASVRRCRSGHGRCRKKRLSLSSSSRIRPL